MEYVKRNCHLSYTHLRSFNIRYRLISIRSHFLSIADLLPDLNAPD